MQLDAPACLSGIYIHRNDRIDMHSVETTLCRGAIYKVFTSLFLKSEAIKGCPLKVNKLHDLKINQVQTCIYNTVAQKQVVIKSLG